jgi:hypothetical protein
LKEKEIHNFFETRKTHFFSFFPEKINIKYKQVLQLSDAKNKEKMLTVVGLTLLSNTEAARNTNWSCLSYELSARDNPQCQRALHGKYNFLF